MPSHFDPVRPASKDARPERISHHFPSTTAMRLRSQQFFFCEGIPPTRMSSTSCWSIISLSIELDIKPLGGLGAVYLRVFSGPLVSA